LLYHITDPQSAAMAGLVVEREVGRIARNANAVFIAEDGSRPAIHGKVQDIGMPGSEGITQQYLSSQFGGAIEMPQPASDGTQAKSSGHLPLRFSAEGSSPEITLVGTITVEATPQSVFSYLLGRVVTVALRESGF
jgi:hypothetical protein